LWQFFGVGYQRVKEGNPPDIDWLTHKPLTYDIAHTDAVLFLDASGHLRFVIDGSPNVQGKQPPAPLTRLLSREGIRNLRHPDQGVSWTVGQVLDVFSWLTNHRLADPA
jgi:protein SCO1/2